MTPARPAPATAKGLLLAGLCVVVTACSPHKPLPVPRGPDAGSNPCASLTYAGFPELTVPLKGTFFICRSGYALEFNPTTKTALWVVEHLTAASVTSRAVHRFDDFRPDPAIPAEQRNDAPHFIERGYDRGQLAPPEDFRDDDARMSQSFYYSNVVAQESANNRGLWVILERNVRAWARDKGEVYVITGPVFSQGQAKAWVGVYKDTGRRYTQPTQKEIIAQKMAVPTHLYKVVLSPQTGESIAFLVPNEAEPATAQALASFAVPVATVEQVAHLTFFPDLPPAQAALKSRISPASWPLYTPDPKGDD